MDAAETRAALSFDRLIPALHEGFAQGATVPTRHHHSLPQADGTTGVLLLMPGWQDGGYLGVKVATIYPGNGARGLPAVHSSYLLCEVATGRPLAMIDGNEITNRRTVGVAALAASYLARDDAEALLIVGAGRIASLAAEAFRAVRPIRRVTVWNLNRSKAATLADQLADQGFEASVALSLRAAVEAADIVSCATLATEPLIRGEWLRPGTHLDLIGSFTPDMREADDTCFARGRVYLDTRDALVESGDLAGVVGEDAVAGTLADLCAGRVAGRRDRDEITIFKAVGTALADVAAATAAYRALFPEET
jgi:ornithine cyclodeaminase